MDYKFKDMPLNLALDWQPTIEFKRTTVLQVTGAVWPFVTPLIKTIDWARTMFPGFYFCWNRIVLHFCVQKRSYHEQFWTGNKRLFRKVLRTISACMLFLCFIWRLASTSTGPFWRTNPPRKYLLSHLIGFSWGLFIIYSKFGWEEAWGFKHKAECEKNYLFYNNVWIDLEQKFNKWILYLGDMIMYCLLPYVISTVWKKRQVMQKWIAGIIDFSMVAISQQVGI